MLAAERAQLRNHHGFDGGLAGFHVRRGRRGGVGELLLLLLLLLLLVRLQVSLG